MTKPCLTDAQARKGFSVSLIVSLLLGMGVGYWRYDSLLDFRSWNVVGVIVILGVAGWASAMALKSAACKTPDAQ